MTTSADPLELGPGDSSASSSVKDLSCLEDEECVTLIARSRVAPDDLLVMVIAPDREVIQALKSNENHQKRRASVDRSLEMQAEEGAVEKMCLCWQVWREAALQERMW